MQRKYLFFFVIGLFASTASTKHAQFYRKDYVYVKQFDAFYKLHWSLAGKEWSSAFATCENEGASLFYVGAPGEYKVPKLLISFYFTTPPNVTDVFIGTHDEFKLGEFVTNDGNVAPNISTPTDAHEELSTDEKRCNLMDINTGKFRVDDCIKYDAPAMFVCKKVDESCPTIDPSYIYLKEFSKCYKVNGTPQTWRDAMRTCFMEGGLLAVIEHSYDGEGIKQLIENDVNYFIGFRKMFGSSDFYTVKGEIYNNDYFTSLYRRRDNVGHDCGVLKRLENEGYETRSHLEAWSCSDALPFICEMELKEDRQNHEINDKISP